jgi:hypothetical protein
MKRREFTAAAMTASLRPNIKWCVSSFLWTSTQWPDKGTLPYTEMLDVIRDTGFNGYRFTGWPGILDRIGMVYPGETGPDSLITGGSLVRHIRQTPSICGNREAGVREKAAVRFELIDMEPIREKDGMKKVRHSRVRMLQAAEDGKVNSFLMGLDDMFLFPRRWAYTSVSPGIKKEMPKQ